MGMLLLVSRNDHTGKLIATVLLILIPLVGYVGVTGP